MAISRLTTAALAIVLFAGSVATGQDKPETFESKRPGRRHMEMAHDHIVRRSGAARSRAKCPACGMMMWGSSPAKELLDKRRELSLADDQVVELKDMDLQYSIDQIDRNALLEKKAIHIRRIFESEPIDLGKLEETLHDAADTGIEMIVSWVDVRQKARAVLTDEQRKILKEMDEPATATKESPAEEKRAEIPSG